MMVMIDFKVVAPPLCQEEVSGLLSVRQSEGGEVIPVFFLGKVLVVKPAASFNVDAICRVATGIEPELTLMSTGYVEVVDATAFRDNESTPACSVVVSVAYRCDYLEDPIECEDVYTELRIICLEIIRINP